MVLYHPLNCELLKIDKQISDIDIDTVSENLSSLFDIKQGESFYTLKRIKENNWEGDIPVYSSNTKNDGILSRIQKSKIKEKDRYYYYCLTWAIDGMAGQLFLRNENNIDNIKDDKYLFTTNNHCGILIPKEKIEFYTRWLYLNKFPELSATIIVEEIRKTYTKISDEELKMKFERAISEIIEANSDNEDFLDWEKLLEVLQEKFDDKKRDLLMKKIIPFSKSFNLSRIEIDLRYVMKNIQPIFLQKTRSYGNQKLGTNQIEDIEISLPVSEDGRFDINTMKKISDEQEKLEKIRAEMLMKLSELKEMQVVFQ